MSKQRVQPGGKKIAVSGGSVHVASESDPGENIGYQLARCRIEGVIVFFFYCLESDTGHSQSPSPPPSKPATTSALTRVRAASLSKSTYTQVELSKCPPPPPPSLCSTVMLKY